MIRRRRQEVAEHVADRRRREDEAPRLIDEFPDLTRLSLSLVERPLAGHDLGAGHIRRVVVESASAVFLLPCAAPGCEAGLHDLTPAVLAELRKRATRFEGSSACVACGCVLSHVGTAEYRPHDGGP